MTNRSALLSLSFRAFASSFSYGSIDRRVSQIVIAGNCHVRKAATAFGTDLTALIWCKLLSISPSMNISKF